MNMKVKIRVWDLPTRVFHWLLAFSVVGLVITSQIGGGAMEWHFRFGYCVLTLLIFRIVWGLVGGRWSRFSAFIYSPTTVFRYLKGTGKPEHSIGHNPMGMASVFALLFFLLFQVASGLVSDDEIAASGPFTRFVSNALVSQATFYHKEVGKLVLLALVVLHVAAILFYLFRNKENLIVPMISGDKASEHMLEHSRDDASSRLLALVIVLISAGLVYAMLKFAAV
jgi:cytochrome b